MSTDPTETDTELVEVPRAWVTVHALRHHRQNERAACHRVGLPVPQPDHVSLSFELRGINVLDKTIQLRLHEAAIDHLRKWISAGQEVWSLVSVEADPLPMLYEKQPRVS